jgi:hypothetical protein
MDEPTTHTEEQPEQEPTQERASSGFAAGAEFVWWVALTVFFVFVALGALAAGAAVWPTSCVPCHSSETTSLADSRHAGVHCDDCHAGTGVFDLVDNRMRVAAMVPAQVIPGGGEGAKVGNEGCLECHGEMLPQTVVSNGVRMNHRAPEDAGWLCSSCHPNVAHMTDEGVSVSSYSMDSCLECHVQSAENITGCQTCHPEDEQPSRPSVTQTSWQIVHGAEWRTMHGMGDLDTCKACHAPSYCSACHTIEMPHPEPFLPRHGELAQDPEALASCTDCHEPASCDGCHGTPMPHPATFLPDHSTTVEQDGDDACYRCHTEDNCTACHTRHAHPGLDDDTTERLRGRPVYTP